jgi:hypothetical protein
MTMHSQGDNRRVALIKSLATNNRFYTLVEPDRGIRNADAVATIPEDLLLGIAYPCLEDGLNDFAVIRTTFETLDLFPEDDPIREEMMEIVNDARGNLLRRLYELRDKIHDNVAHFLGTDYNEFKDYALAIVNKGYPRRNLDSMMKLNVFTSVAEAEGHSDANELLYYFEFAYSEVRTLMGLPPREFIVSLLDEAINSVKDDQNYTSKYQFDKNVFQKFIAVMFVNYATTDPMFYGINKRDYGVSGDKDMEDTPLYRAIARELREIEARLHEERNPFSKAPVIALPNVEPGVPDFSLAAPVPIGEVPEPSLHVSDSDHAGRVSYEQASHMLPDELVNEDVLLGPLTSLCSAAQLLRKKNDPETQRFARVILADASNMVKALKRLGIVSQMANDPGQCD